VGKLSNTGRGTSNKPEADPATTGPMEGHREATACHVGFVETLWKSCYHQFITMDMMDDVS